MVLEIIGGVVLGVVALYALLWIVGFIFGVALVAFIKSLF